MSLDAKGIDEQKVFFFPGRLSQWLEGSPEWKTAKKIYPLYIEVSPAGACNHRCVFCALDFMGYRRQLLDKKAYRSFVSVAARKGVRSIMFGGEGEPLLHPFLADMVAVTKKHGIDTAITTNGVLLSGQFLQKSLPYLNWIKVSLDAGTAGTHSRIHRCSHSDFERILDNIACAVRLKKKLGSRCDIGVQAILLPENISEIIALARKIKKIGADYFVVKPYSPGLWSRNIRDIDYTCASKLARRVESLSDSRFHATFRTRAFSTAQAGGGGYRFCNAVPYFWAYCATNGDIYSCSNFLGKKRFCLGNIKRQSFDRIWEGERRKQNWKFIQHMPTGQCRVNCRMNSVNSYLELLKNPYPNHTFI